MWLVLCEIGLLGGLTKNRDFAAQAGMAHAVAPGWTDFHVALSARYDIVGLWEGSGKRLHEDFDVETAGGAGDIEGSDHEGLAVGEVKDAGKLGLPYDRVLGAEAGRFRSKARLVYKRLQ